MPRLVRPRRPSREWQELQVRQVLAERLEHQSPYSVPTAQLARLALAQAQPARRRAGLPGYRPWETSGPEAGRTPATHCQEQSPARHHRPLAASLRPLRHDTTGAIDGPIRFAFVPRVNLARRALKKGTNHATFCENGPPGPRLGSPAPLGHSGGRGGTASRRGTGGGAGAPTN